MSRDRLSRAGGLPVRMLGSLGALAALMVLMFVFVGKKDGPRQAGDQPAQEAAERTTRRCEDELERILSGMAPARLGISSDRISLLNELIRWNKTCGLKDEAESLAQDEEIRKKLLEGEMLARTSATRFLPEDVSHVREGMLARAIVSHLSKTQQSETERIASVFNFVIRNVLLIPEDSNIALTPYETLLFGTGRAADRANVFASLLRQLRVDAVIVQPRDEAQQNNWLVGVIAPQSGVLLFDCRMGLPIPSAEETAAGPFPNRVATLEEVRGSNASFRLLDDPQAAYPLTSEAFKEVDIKIIGNSSVWAPRIAELQFLLPKQFQMDLYDGLGPNQLRQPGVLERLVAAGREAGWTEADISVWEFPELQIVQIESARGVEGTSLAGLLEVFEGPYVLRENVQRGSIDNAIEHSLHEVRVQQLSGQFVDALKNYLPIRNSTSSQDIPANRIAADYATLWTGVCQYETGAYRAAFNTFQRSLASPQTGATSPRAAIEWVALSLLANKQYAEAAEVLSQAPPDLSPYRDAYLIRRWEQLARGAETPSPEATGDANSEPETPAAPANEAPPAADGGDSDSSEEAPAPSDESAAVPDNAQSGEEAASDAKDE